MKITTHLGEVQCSAVLVEKTSASELHTSDNQGYVDGFVRELSFTNDLMNTVCEINLCPFRESAPCKLHHESEPLRNQI